MKTPTEQERNELQKKFEAEKGINVTNSQGEFDIDYVAWLEQIVITSQSPAVAEVKELPNNRAIEEQSIKDYSQPAMVVSAVEAAKRQRFSFAFFKGASWVRDKASPIISSLKSENERLKLQNKIFEDLIISSTEENANLEDKNEALEKDNERLKAELAEKKEQILMVKSHLGIANKEISELLSERVASGNSLREILPLSTEDIAVEFAEWLAKEGWDYSLKKDNTWVRVGEYKTTSELYQIFLKETSSNGEGKE